MAQEGILPQKDLYSALDDSSGLGIFIEFIDGIFNMALFQESNVIFKIIKDLSFRFEDKSYYTIYIKDMIRYAINVRPFEQELYTPFLSLPNFENLEFPTISYSYKEFFTGTSTLLTNIQNLINSSNGTDITINFRFGDFHQSYSILDFSALYGSMPLFKYLLLNDLKPNHNTLLCAIMGGNLEIVKTILDKHSNIEVDKECIIASAQYVRNNIVDYLIKNYDNFDIRLIPDEILYYNSLLSFYKAKNHPLILTAQRIKNMHLYSLSMIFRGTSDSKEILKDFSFKTKYNDNPCLSSEPNFHFIVELNTILKKVLLFSDNNSTKISNIVYNAYAEYLIDGINSQTDKIGFLSYLNKYKSFLSINDNFINIINGLFEIIVNKVTPEQQHYNETNKGWSFYDKAYLLYNYYKDGIVQVTPMKEIGKTLNTGQAMICRLKKELGRYNRNEEKAHEEVYTNKTPEHYKFAEVTSLISDMKKLEKEIVSIINNEDLLLIFKSQNRRRDPPEYILKNLVQACRCMDLCIESLSNMKVDMTSKRHDNSKKLTPLLLSFGKKTFNTISEYFGLQCLRASQMSKQKQIEELFNGYIPKFDGSREDVTYIFKNFYNDHESLAQGGILAIDGASIEPNVVIHENGDVLGIAGLSKIDPSEAKEIIADIEKRKEFYKQHEKQILSHIFIILFCPTSCNLQYIPIMKCEVCSGSATDEIKNKLEGLADMISQQLNINVVGYGMDGDPKYLVYATDFWEICLNNFLSCSQEFNKKLYNIHQCKIPCFYDSIHLSKNDRNKLSTGNTYYTWPSNDEITISCNEYEECGIPKKIFTTNNKEKQHDRYPMQLYSIETLKMLTLQNRNDLAFNILPTALLLTVIFKDGLSREDRINLLTIAHALIFMYLVDRTHIGIEENNQRQYHKKKSTEDITYARYTEKWCTKMLIVTYLMSCQLAKYNESLNMAALGSNLVEHFFGNLRYLSHHDKSINGMINAMMNIMIHTEDTIASWKLYLLH